MVQTIGWHEQEGSHSNCWIILHLSHNIHADYVFGCNFDSPLQICSVKAAASTQQLSLKPLRP